MNPGEIGQNRNVFPDSEIALDFFAAPAVVNT